MDFEVTGMTDMEQIVGFVFAAVGTHHPVVDVNRSKRATVRTDLTPSTRTPRDFLTHLGRDGGHDRCLRPGSGPLNVVVSIQSPLMPSM
jgi:hypothetical protein